MTLNLGAIIQEGINALFVEFSYKRAGFIQLVIVIKKNLLREDAFMLYKNLKILLLSFLFSFMLYLSFKPWDYTDFMHHIIMFFLVLLFPLVITINYIKNNMKVFWFSALFFFIGLLFLYRGFYMNNQFYLLDYIFYRNVQTTIEIGDTTIHGHPLSLWWIESVLLYSAFSIVGLIVGYFVEIKKETIG